ncbi:AAA family ATPase [Bogoriella caseilytica]|uniref:AAA family ATPase n=1 Tax=Bogoriella caseilytica TaxID=56055 RepID=UPI0011CD7A1E|nr:hypothetical protein [Bogoriella caseilytica]
MSAGSVGSAMGSAHFDTVVINGSVGTGKTTTAEGLGTELEQLGIPGAVIDADWLRWSWPAPEGDPFRLDLALQNMRAVASNFRSAGAQVLVVAGVIESLEELRRTEAALDASRLLHVRLAAADGVVSSRLARRHEGDAVALEWHASRHPELAQILDQAGFEEELLIDTSGRPVSGVVDEILAAVTSR